MCNSTDAAYETQQEPNIQDCNFTIDTAPRFAISVPTRCAIERLKMLFMSAHYASCVRFAMIDVLRMTCPVLDLQSQTRPFGSKLECTARRSYPVHSSNLVWYLSWHETASLGTAHHCFFSFYGEEHLFCDEYSDLIWQLLVAGSLT